MKAMVSPRMSPTAVSTVDPLSPSEEGTVTTYWSVKRGGIYLQQLSQTLSTFSHRAAAQSLIHVL